MNKLIVILLAVFLFAGCDQTNPEQTTASTTEPTTAATTQPTTAATTQPTTAPTTEATTAPTEATEPTVDLSWQTAPVYPSYAEFLAAEPAFAELNCTSWLIVEKDGGVEYSFDAESFTVMRDGKAVYHVPNQKELEGYHTWAADGKYGYIKNDTEILKIDLQTGDVIGSIQIGRILCIRRIVDSFVWYYVEHDGEHFNICRVYLPEMKRDVLDSFAAPANVYEDDDTYTRSDGNYIRWVIRNPEMMELLETELKKPESSYQKPTFHNEVVDFSFVWQKENVLNEWDLNQLDMFLYTVQEKSGIQAFVEYEYHIPSNTLTTRTGIIDNCYFGTGDPHDHFKPEITEIAGPTVVNSSWKPIPNQDIQGVIPEKPMGTFTVEQLRFGTDPMKLYRKQNGYLTELAELSFKTRQDREDAIYGITQDNRLVQLSYDGTVCNTLYTGIGTLRDIMYLQNGFYLVDDNQIIEIDMATGQYRVLIEQDYLWDIDYWNEKEGTIYFLASEGLAYQQHKYDPVTAVLEKVSVMW